MSALDNTTLDPTVLVPGVSLLGGHMLTLPTPSAVDPALSRAIAALRLDSDRGRFAVVHVLSADCKCSARILEALSARPALEGFGTTVLFVGPEGSKAAAARAAGLRVIGVAPEELSSRYHIGVAPLLIVSDPAGEIRYVGGYGPRKQSAEIVDERIISDLRQGRPTELLPVFGCAVSRPR